METYISQFSMIADYNGWQEEERKFHLAASLKDKARQVLPADGRLTSITYAQLCERLISGSDLGSNRLRTSLRSTLWRVDPARPYERSPIVHVHMPSGVIFR